MYSMKKKAFDSEPVCRASTFKLAIPGSSFLLNLTNNSFHTESSPKVTKTQRSHRETRMEPEYFYQEFNVIHIGYCIILPLVTEDFPHYKSHKGEKLKQIPTNNIPQTTNHKPQTRGASEQTTSG